MKLHLTILSFLLSGGIALAEQTSTASDVIREVQSERFTAMIESDCAALDRILADDLVYTHTTGRSESKSEFIDSVTSGAISYDAISPTDSQIRLYDDTAIVNGKSDMRVSAGERHFEMSIRFIEVYQVIDGRWQLVSWQSTRIPQERE